MRKLLRRKAKSSPYVYIMGSGPAGLFAAQAVYEMGGVARIWSKGRKSEMYGAQYLHAPIPGLDCGKQETVSYLLRGTADGYRRKVYGDGASIKVSPETLASQHAAWDIRAAYDDAWERFKGIVTPLDISPVNLIAAAHETERPADLIVWSIPLAPQCIRGHSFGVQEVWAQGDAPDLGLFCSVEVEPWTVVANGEESPRWYRASNVYGHRTAEWPDGPKPPIKGIARVSKPIANNCDCWMEFAGAPVLRVGRYGTWTKGELSHQAYERTRAALEAL